MENNSKSRLGFPIRVAKLRDVKLPSKGTLKSAGIDFYVPEDFRATVLRRNGHVVIPSGIKIELPPNKALVFFNKSGVATKQNLQVGACVIDEDYQGEIGIHVRNIGVGQVTIKPGQKIVQGLILSSYDVSIEEVSEEDLYFDTESERGEGGFGSTGI